MASRMVIESIGWKHLLGAVLILVSVAIVIARRDQFTPGKIIAIGLMILGSVFLFLSTVFRFHLGFVDLELAAIIVWVASLGVALMLLGQDGNVETDS